MQPGRARTSGLGVPPLPLARWVAWVAPVRPTHGVLINSCPSAALRVHVCEVSWATWLLFASMPARCVVLRVRRPELPGSRSPVCLLGALLCVCGVLGHLAPVHRCARVFCCVACPVSWATWLLFTGVPARCAVLRVRCPGLLGSCSPVCVLRPLLCLCGVLGHLAPFPHCGRSVCCAACAVSWATWLLVTGAPAWCVALLVRCPLPLDSCSPVCLLGVLFCMCGVLGHCAPVHRCPRSVCCVACTVSWPPLLLFTDVPARCIVLLVWCPGSLGSCSPVCPLSVLCRVCGVLCHFAPVHRCVCPVCSGACTVSQAPLGLLTGSPALCVVLRVRCPGPLGSCSPVCPRGVLCCVCAVLGHLAPVHQRARSVCCVACAVSWAPGPCSPMCSLARLCCVCGVLGHLAPVHRCARSVCWVVLRVRCPGPLGSCPPVCSLGVLWWVCGVLNYLAPVHRCARSVCCAVGCVCGASLRGAHSSLRTAAVCTPQVQGTLRARTRPSGRRVFRSRQGLGTLRGRTRPSRRRLFRSGQRLGLLSGTHTSVRTAAGVAWHLFSCRGLLHLLLAPPALLGGCAGHAGACRERGSLCLPLAPAEAGALGSLRVVPVRGPSMGLSPAGPSGVCWVLCLCVVLRCLLLLLVVPCVWSSRQVGLFAVWFAVLVCVAVCCVVLCVSGCGAVLRCCALCRPVLRCCVLFSFVALVWCRLLCRALWRCSSPWGPAVCGAAFCGAPPRCVLCAVCALSWRVGACCCSPLCFLLCVSCGVLPCVSCPLHSVRCCAALCWCACVVLCVWYLLLLAPGAVVRCFPVSCSVVLCCPVVLCCRALLSFSGAVCARFALPCPVVRRRAVLCCDVGCVRCFWPGCGVCVLWCHFPPCQHAKKTLIIALCYPAPVSVSAAYGVEESGPVVCRFVVDPGSVVFDGVVLFVLSCVDGVVFYQVSDLPAARQRAKPARVGQKREQEVHGEENKARGREFRGVAS